MDIDNPDRLQDSLLTQFIKKLRDIEDPPFQIIVAHGFIEMLVDLLVRFL